MTLLHSSLTKRAVLSGLFFGAIACSDSNTTNPPSLATLNVTFPAASIEIGQPDTAAASGLDQSGAGIASGKVTWSSSATNVATVDTNGIITGVATGTANIIATVGDKTGQKTVTVTAPAGIKLNEVESNGGTPGDWAEFYNPTSAAIDISGWVMKDNDDTHVYTFPVGTHVPAGGYYVAEEADFVFGLGAPDAVRIYSKYGVLVDSYSWTSHAAVTYGRCPNGTGAFASTTSSTKGTANDCSVPVRINEVESDNGVPGDWIELYNMGASPVNLTGYVLKDNDDTHNYTFASGTTIAAGGFLVVDESALGFGLGSADAARLFDPNGTLIDSYTWTSHATTTYGRCPDGTGAFTTTTTSTKGTANACPGSITAAPWPGIGTDVQTVDGMSVFGGNLSGLMYEASGSGISSDVMWGIKNGPGTLYRLVWNGTIWTPDASNSWSAGKALHFPDGTGDPDAEGVTYAAGGSAGGIYVSTERDNNASTVNRLSVLLIDPTQSGSTITATREWNLTNDLPPVGTNVGLEGIAWIPDSYLVSKGFYDDAAGHAYTPATYPDHGTGLFFVGLEANGMIYAYALNQSSSTFTRIATISSGYTAVMELSFNGDLGYLWATCDDGCGNLASTLEINSSGHFAVTRVFARPSSMSNINNEGFTIAPESECSAGAKYVYWSDDSEDNGHAIRRATMTCGALAK